MPFLLLLLHFEERLLIVLHSENVGLPVEFYGLEGASLADIGHLTEYVDIIERNRLGVNDTLRDVL